MSVYRLQYNICELHIHTHNFGISIYAMCFIIIIITYGAYRQSILYAYFWAKIVRASYRYVKSLSSKPSVCTQQRMNILWRPIIITIIWHSPDGNGIKRGYCGHNNEPASLAIEILFTIDTDGIATAILIGYFCESSIERVELREGAELHLLPSIRNSIGQIIYPALLNRHRTQLDNKYIIMHRAYS